MTTTQTAPEAWTIEQTAGLFPHLADSWSDIEATYQDMRTRTIAASLEPGCTEEKIVEEEQYFRPSLTLVYQYAGSMHTEGEIEPEQVHMVRDYVAVQGLTQQISAALENVHGQAPATLPADYDPTIQGVIKPIFSKRYVVRTDWHTGNTIAYRRSGSDDTETPFPEHQQARAKELIRTLAIRQYDRRNLQQHNSSVNTSKAFLGRLGIIGKPLAERRTQPRSAAHWNTPLNLLRDVPGNRYK